MVTIISGAPGSGKTKTAQFLFETTDKSALIDGDSLLATNPQNRTENRHLRYKNIASIATNYFNAGFINIFIAFVYVREEDLLEQVELLKDLGKIKFFVLIPNNDVLRDRHTKDLYKREDIESSINLNNKIKDLENIEKIDNSFISIDQVANIIKETVGI